MSEQATKAVLRRPRPPQEMEEAPVCAGAVSVWLEQQDYLDSPALQGYCSQDGIPLRPVSQQESILVFYGDEALTERVTVPFSKVMFVRVRPLAVTDETPT